MAAEQNTAIVYGGSGALGSACVKYFKAKGYNVISFDLVANEEANSNVVLSAKSGLQEQGDLALQDLGKVLGDKKVQTIICVAGGWAGGNAASADMLKNADLMFRQSVWTSLIASRIAATYLAEGGLLALTGAIPALGATPGMIGYGMAKAAVHQLVKSLSEAGSGMPDGSCTLALLPMTLDTPMNRKFMADADQSTWTPLDTVAELLFKWVSGVERPASGSLAQLRTANSTTNVVFE
eukprot:m.11283 g.11283  ORF g.11283 m.11283 type:complete len:238 (+) comp5691_c1_seq1:400-1113(+)